MKNLDYCNGLRIYGVYLFDKYPDVYIVCVNIFNNLDKPNVFRGLAFSKDGIFETIYEIDLPLSGVEVGYIYTKNINFTLKLENKYNFKTLTY